MRKLTVASIASVCMVPMLFASQDASAVPAFARKYQTSCYTCHSGFPNRNAFGEAFKNNGYRWPGGEDEEKSKQEQTKMGSDGWKKTFPESPWPSDIPGFAPFALYITGPLVNYSDQVKDKNNVEKTKQALNWNGPDDARILFGGTIGENIGIVGAIEGIGKGTTTTNMRVTYAFAPGVNLGFGNGFSAFTGLATPLSVYTSVFPASGTSVEVNYNVGKTGGFNVIAGLASKDKTGSSPVTSKLDDTSYLRLKYKFGGAGLLSGAGGTYGNEFVGLDNCFQVGASVVGARPTILTGTYTNETLVYGVDASGNYGSFTGGAAISKGRELSRSNYAVDAGYYIYPWMLARVKYASLGDLASKTNPTITPSLTAWLRANVSLAASYKIFTKHIDPTQVDGRNNANTFSLTAGLAF